MTIEDLVNQLLTAPDLQAPALILLDGVPHQVRSASHTGFEPHPATPPGVALIRIVPASPDYQEP